ncbi:peptidylprolyl isomerase [Gracilimonas mengyeensis]|uniref:peptidylprolyl isomerase n=1 Tax=Gracilimonas mengyeensis TaxID=1302730 RepID=A0A521B7C7_9BACT|nr:peptidylprolyl isomerase [Gracilimonas mengyeensis]SMO42590.1 PPIC-type PPIASE domain-containing protein [Gracilimonas mengyeensis]
MHTKRFLSISFLVGVALLFMYSCSNQEDGRAYDVIAEVENIGDITFADLHNYYDSYLYHLRYPNDKQKGYKEALEELIVKRRKEAEFINTQMYTDEELMEPIQRSVNEEIRARYFEDEFLSRYINEESIEDYYESMGRKVEYRQIVINKPAEPVEGQLSAIRDTVNLIVSELMVGEDFGTYVERYSQHQPSLENAGYMPPISWKNVAQSPMYQTIYNMSEGDLRALENRRAFHIINVTDVGKTEKPPLVEVENQIRKNLRELYLDRALEEYTELKNNIINADSFEWNELALDELTEWGKQEGFYGGAYKQVLSEAIASGNNKTIVTHENGSVDYQKYLQLLNTILIPGKEENISKEDLKKFIDDAVRTELILEQSKKAGADSEILTENATSILRFHYERMYTRRHITEQIPEPTDEALRSFYEAHKDSLLYQFAKSILYVKPFGTEAEAEEMMQKINAGQSFEQAANRRYQVKTFIINKQGEIEAHLSDEKPYLGEVAFDLKEGEVEGPVSYSEDDTETKYAVVKNSFRQEARVRDFSEIKDIAKQFREFKRGEISKQVRENLSQKYPANIYQDILEQKIEEVIQ